MIVFISLIFNYYESNGNNPEFDRENGSIFDQIKRTRKMRLPKRSPMPSASLLPSRTPEPSPFPTITPLKIQVGVDRGTEEPTTVPATQTQSIFPTSSAILEMTPTSTPIRPIRQGDDVDEFDYAVDTEIQVDAITHTIAASPKPTDSEKKYTELKLENIRDWGDLLNMGDEVNKILDNYEEHVDEPTKDPRGYRRIAKTYYPTPSQESSMKSSKCHSSAHFYNGKCICGHGLVGDGIAKCSFPKPDLINVRPKVLFCNRPSVIIVEIKKMDFVPQGAFCKIGGVIVGGNLTTENIIACEVKPRRGRKKVSVSFDGINWGHNEIEVSFENSYFFYFKMFLKLSFSMTAGVFILSLFIVLRNKILVRIRLMRHKNKKNVNIQRQIGHLQCTP